MNSVISRSSTGLALVALVASSAIFVGSPAGAAARTDSVVPVSTASVADAVTQPAEAKAEQSQPSAVSAGSADVAQKTVDPFRMVGVSWQADSAISNVVVKVQVRQAGTWSSWQTLELDDDTPGVGGTDATVPWWLQREADGVAVQLTADGGTPVGVEVTTIDPGDTPTPTAGGDAAPLVAKKATATSIKPMAATSTPTGDVGTGPGGSDTSTAPAPTPTATTPTTAPIATAVAQPTIITRAQWGAAAGGSCSSPQTASTSKGIVLHHTDGSNNYTADQSAAIVRGIQTFHITGRGWCDIGYNFLVDRYGQIFEGRKGGIYNQVRGAHSDNWNINLYTTGISMMGNFETGQLTDQLKDAVARLVAWRSSLFGFPIYGTFVMDGKTYPDLMGHRDVKSTDCPGKYGYAWLNDTGADGLRARAQAYVNQGGGTATASFSTNSLTMNAATSFVLKGHGFGHGMGMSQYGAQGAALQGKSSGDILGYYYPGTVQATKTGYLRVLLSGDTTRAVAVKAKKGLRFNRVGSSKKSLLPTKRKGKTVKQWKIDVDSKKKSQLALYYRITTKWYRYAASAVNAQFLGPASIGVIMPNGSVVSYRGKIRAVRVSSSDINTVNVLPLESYVRGVVAREMPASWAPAALQAQAVAARTYAAQSMGSSGLWDICDTTACQVYGGVSAETPSTDSAIGATRNVILTYNGAPAFTQFSASSGGWSKQGSKPYLKSQADTWDTWAGNPFSTWQVTLTAATIQKAYPSIGTLTGINIVSRDGNGSDGGRVNSLSITGSKATVTVSGSALRSKLGLRSDWFFFG